jgi:itaconyl-CoA hydratase
MNAGGVWQHAAIGAYTARVDPDQSLTYQSAPKEDPQLSAADERAPVEWRGRFFEDFEVGDVYRSRLGRTVTKTDNQWFTLLTLNTNQMHFNDAYAEGTPFGQPLVNSVFTLALVTGMSVPDTSENATANLSWNDIKLPRPVFEGDTLWSESEILELRESASRPNVGIVSIRTRGINQKHEVVIEFRRTFMVYKRDAPEVTDTFPHTDAEWAV